MYSTRVYQVILKLIACNFNELNSTSELRTYFCFSLALTKVFGDEPTLEDIAVWVISSAMRKALRRRSRPEVYLRRIRIRSVTGQHCT